MVTKTTSKSQPPSKPPSKQSTASNRPVALITGASSGIGEALAHCFAAGGHDVILVARSADKLKALSLLLASSHGIKAEVAAADLTKPGAVGNLAAVLKRKGVSVNMLVNCAGVLEQGAFSSMDAGVHQQMIDLNISALTAMLSAFVPEMTETAQLQGRQGRILNVASIAAFQPIPMLATYAASKAFVLSLSESLSEELKNSRVSVTALCPGITATNMLSMATGANDKLSKLPGFLVAPVKDVAQAGYDATMRGDAICVPGAINQVGMISSRATPKWIVRKIGGIFGRNVM
jgi:short-subunit dehydrogenase